jgi:hypothetical protein
MAAAVCEKSKWRKNRTMENIILIGWKLLGGNQGTTSLLQQRDHVSPQFRSSVSWLPQCIELGLL